MQHNEPGNKKNLTKEEALQLLAAQGFVHIKEVAAGVTGFASVFKFDPDKSNASSAYMEMMQGITTKDGYFIGKMQLHADAPAGVKKSVMQKHAEATFANEFDIVSGALHGHGKSHLPGVGAIEANSSDANPVRLIASQPVYLDAQKKAFSTLEDYMQELGAHHQNQIEMLTPDEKKNLAAETGKQFSSIFTATHAAFSELHDMNTLHLDGLPRNLAMHGSHGVKLLDFGNSLPMNEKGHTADVKFPVNPLSGYSSETITGIMDNKVHQKSIHDDFFSCRIAMIESMAGYMGVTSRNDLLMRIHLSGLNLNFTESLCSEIVALFPDVNVTDSQACIEQAMHEKEQLLSAIGMDKSSIDEIYAAIDKNEDQLESIPDEIEVIDQEVVEQSQELQDLDEKIEAYSENDEDVPDELYEQRQELVDAILGKPKNEEIKEKYNQLNQALESLEEEKSDLYDKKDELQDKISAHSDRLATVESVLGKMQTEGEKTSHRSAGSVDRLQNSLNNLEAHAKQLAAKQDVRGEVCMKVIGQYKKYISTMPSAVTAENNLDAVRVEDQAVFGACRSPKQELSSSAAMVGAVLGHTRENKLEPAAVEKEEAKIDQTLSSAEKKSEPVQEQAQENDATKSGPDRRLN